MKKLLIVFGILLLINCQTFSQNWIKQTDPFTKKITWETQWFKIKIKTNGFFDTDFLFSKLIRNEQDTIIGFSFKTSIRYEAIADEKSSAIFLFDNDSTKTIYSEYGKSELIQPYGSESYYNAVIWFKMHDFLNNPLKGIRFNLYKSYKDYTLKEEGSASFLYFLNKATLK